MTSSISPSQPSDASSRARRVFLWVLALNIAVIILAIVLGIFKHPDKSNPTRYFGEGRFPTVVSIVQLAAVAVLCTVVGKRRFGLSRGDDLPTRGAFIWMIFAAGFTFLALDEWLEIHEKMDSYIHRAYLGHEATNLTDRIDDLIILAYGLVGLAVIAAYRRELVRYRCCIPYLTFSAAAAVLSIGMDALTNREDVISGALHTWLTVGDDAFKLLAEAGFVGAACAALVTLPRGG